VDKYYDDQKLNFYPFFIYFVDVESRMLLGAQKVDPGNSPMEACTARIELILKVKLDPAYTIWKMNSKG